MKRLSIILLAVLLNFLAATPAHAQDMADVMRSNGKIYVVVFVLATIFAGIFCFLVYLERKMKKLESNKK
jgi:hypothetical protein